MLGAVSGCWVLDFGVWKCGDRKIQPFASFLKLLSFTECQEVQLDTYPRRINYPYFKSE